MSSPAPSRYEYGINADDIITYVSPAFLAFAQENAAPELTSGVLCGSSLFRFIADDTTRQLYAMVFDHVRTQQRPVTVPFRCDSPTLRRFMELTLSLGPKGAIELAGVLIRTEPCTPVLLLDRAIPRSEDFLEACCFCKKILAPEGAWLEPVEAIVHLGLFNPLSLPRLTHSVCPSCHPAFLKRLGL